MKRVFRISGRRDERGMALVSLLTILAALTILGVGLIVFSTTELRIADNQRNHAGALYVAEAGIAEVKARLSTTPGTTTVTVNGATFDPAIGDNPLNPDPNWRTELYLTDAGSLPAPVGTETIVATVQPSAGWLRYGDPSAGLQPIVVEHKWIDRDLDGLRETGEVVLYDAGRHPPENFDTGHPVEVVTVPAILNGARRQILTEVTRFPVNVGVPAAITCDLGVDLTGNLAACGHNHDLATPVGTMIPACHPFELCSMRTLDVPAGCQFSVMTTGDPALTGGSSDVEGFPAWSDTSSSNTFHDIHEYLGIPQDIWNDIKADPDYTSSNDAVNMDGIVVVDHDATASEKFNGNDGFGLIYVNGDMEIAGNFVWRGLIYVEGDCVVLGTAWILGAILVRGSSAVAFAAGNTTVLYSRDAINMYVSKGLDYTTLAWNEL